MNYAADAVINALTVAYINDGKFRTIAEIAALAGVSETTARKRIDQNFHSAASLLESETDVRESNKNFATHYSRVRVYAPSRKFLLSILRVSLKTAA